MTKIILKCDSLFLTTSPCYVVFTQDTCSRIVVSYYNKRLKKYKYC